MRTSFWSAQPLSTAPPIKLPPKNLIRAQNEKFLKNFWGKKFFFKFFFYFQFALGDNKCKKIALTYSGWFSFACMLINWSWRLLILEITSLINPLIGLLTYFRHSHWSINIPSSLWLDLRISVVRIDQSKPPSATNCHFWPFILKMLKN